MAFLLSFTGMFYLGLNPDLINTNWPWVLFTYNLIVSFLALMFLFFTFKKLKKNQSRDVLGSKFTWTFIKIIPIIALVPVASFYLFSFQTVQETLSNLSVSAKNVINNLDSEVMVLDNIATKTIEQIYIDNTTSNFLAIDGFIKYQNETRPDEPLELKTILESLVKTSLACQLSLYDKNNVLMAETDKKRDCYPDTDDIDIISDSQPYTFNYYPVKNEKNKFLAQTIVSTRFYSRTPVKDYYTLSSVFKVSNLTYQSLIKLNQSLSKWKQFNLKFPTDNPILRKRFLIDFSTTVLLTILAVLVIVIIMINRLMKPLHSLSKATREISKGNYDVQVKSDDEDSDLNMLIKHFNEMSDQIRQSREGLDTHNVYLETILQYSYGVIALDSKKNIQFLNPIAVSMLALDANKSYVGSPYKEINKKNKNLKKLIDLIGQNFVNEKWSSEIKVSFLEQNKLILCQGTILRTNTKTLGYLIVLNDITELNWAQKKAAWGEVAMKMAHEVKNPLTPILLSADRLRNKFLDSLKGKDLEIMEKTTTTIIDQVKSMSIMVEAFSEFANTPKITKSPQNLNSIINKVVELYDADEGVEISLDLSGALPETYIDSESIKRLFINLIKNSKEAKISEITKIKISSEFNRAKKIIKITIDDNGNGFDIDIIDKIFEPYASTKITGSGLGLAIVHNIVEQHNGAIHAENIKPSGARIVIELPTGN